MVMRRDGSESGSRAHISLNSYGFPAPDLSDQSPMLFVDLLTRPWYQDEALLEPRLRHHLRISIILLLHQHGPNATCHPVGQRDRDQHFRFALQNLRQPTALANTKPCRPVITDIAPVISRLRISFWPIFETLPSRSLPPVDCCIGTRPSQAPKSRPRSKQLVSGAKASIAKAVCSPAPGIVVNLCTLPDDFAMVSSCLSDRKPWLPAFKCARRTSARHRGRCRGAVGILVQCGDQLFQPCLALRADHPVFGQMPAQGVDGLCALPDQHLSGSEQRGAGLS